MHMPLFAFLSGIVYKEEYSLNFQKVRIFIVKKIEKLYIPFEAYSLFFLLLHNFFYKINFIGEINGNKILSGVRKTIRFDSYIRWWRITDRSVMVSDSAIWIGNHIHSSFVPIQTNKKDKECNCVVAVIVAFIYILFSNLNLLRNLSNASWLILFYSAGYFCKNIMCLSWNGAFPSR